MAYSEDLRQRVIGFIEEEAHKSKVSSRFTVYRETIYQWLRLGVHHLKPKKTGPKAYTRLDIKKLEQTDTRKSTSLSDDFATALGVSRFAIS